VTEDFTSGPKVRTRTLVAPAEANPKHSPSLSKLSMNEVTTYRWSLLDDVIAYSDAGYEAIGIWRPKLAEFGEERGIDLVRESGLSVSSV